MKETVVILVIAWLAVSVAVWAMQRRMMYYPDTTVPDAAMWQAAGFEVVAAPTADGLVVESWYAAPASPDAPVLVWFQGNAGHHGHRAYRAAPYLEAGWGVMLAGYRGYGGNPGAPSEEGLYADGRAAVDWLETRGIAPGRIVLYGESLGSGVAIEVASARNLGAVVLQAPFTSMTDVAAHHYWYLPVRWFLLDRYDSAARIGAIDAPLLILHSDDDPVVPARFSAALFAAAVAAPGAAGATGPRERLLFPGAGHNGYGEAGVDRRVIEWVERHLGVRDSR